MTHLWRTIGLLVIVAASVAGLTYHFGRDGSVNEALSRRDALAWLRTDFRLNDAQFEAIRKLHQAYSVVCERHCEAIQEAAMSRNALKVAPNTERAVLAGAERKLEELRLVCENAIAAHVREVAAQMSPDQGQRYLALVLPRIAGFDHRAAPDLDLNTHRH
jgi:hypothetical protein